MQPLRPAHLFTAVCCCLIMACGSDSDTTAPGSETIDDSPVVSLTLTIDGINGSTRAGGDEGPTWGDPYSDEIGTDFDNRISLSSVRVLIYPETEAQPVAEVTEMACYPTGLNEYQLIGTVRQLGTTTAAAGSYRVMVMANCPDDGGNPGDMTFGTADTAYPDGHIPMWGVATVPLRFEGREEIGTIDLLRAAAKIEVELKEDAAVGYCLSAVYIDRYNGNGYCLPAEWNGVGTTKALSFLKDTTPYCSRPYASAVSTRLDFKPVDESRMTYVVYLPEYDTTTDNQATISVEIQSNAEEETPEVFSFSGDNGIKVDCNIVRNHYYKYTITGIRTGIGLNYDVWKMNQMTIHVPGFE